MSYSIQISGTVLRSPLPPSREQQKPLHRPLPPGRTQTFEDSRSPPRCSRAVIYGRKETRTNFRIILHHFSCPHDTALLEIRTPNPTRKKNLTQDGVIKHITQHIAHLHRKAAARSFCAGSFLARQTAGETQFLVTSRNNNSHRKEEKKNATFGASVPARPIGVQCRGLVPVFVTVKNQPHPFPPVLARKV